VLLVGIIGNISAGILAGPMMVGYMRMIKTDDEGGKIEIGDVFKGFDDFIPALLAVLVGGIAVGIGFMLCIIPGLLVMAVVPPRLPGRRRRERTASTRSSAPGKPSRKTCSAPSCAR